MPAEFREYVRVQSIAKGVLSELAGSLQPGDSERTIAERAVRLLAAEGIQTTWYYDCPALVLAGSRTCDSISGRDYRPRDEAVGDFSLVTVDLSPCRGDVWGDCARSFCIEQGCYAPQPETPEFRQGLDLERTLHAEVRDFARPDTTFEELYDFASRRIREAGFANLDFAGNFGHSIPTRLEDRTYLVRGNRQGLGDVPFFTFEPHLRAAGGQWGFKHENIYYFTAAGRLEEL